MLTDSLNWKYLGVTSGKNTITYPSDARYLRCDVFYLKVNESTSQALHSVEEIDLQRLSDEYTHCFLNGGYYSNTDYFTNNIAVDPASQIAYLLMNSKNGVDNSANCSMNVWYK